ncbi:MAG: ATP-binding protein [Bacillota bacterium]
MTVTQLELAGLLPAVLESLPEPLILVDPLGNVVLRNRASREMTGLKPGEAMNIWDRNNLTLWYEDGTPVAREDYPARRLLRGLPISGEHFRAERRDGKRLWIEVHGVTIPAGGPVQLCIVVYRDITSMREVQEARLDYFRAVSHDLRSPLSVIRAQSQLLLRSLSEKGLQAEASRASDTIRTADRMNLMIGSLSESIRAEAGRLRLNKAPVDISSLARSVADRMAILAGSRLRLELPGGPATAVCDESRIERCIENLLSNALRYSLPPSPVDLRVRGDDGWVMVEVEDRGPGIDPGDMPRIFERFYRGKAGAGIEGLGLGLYVSRIAVEAHGGTIDVKSSLGCGSTFTLRIPREASGRNRSPH